jgi:hypothetical protein
VYCAERRLTGTEKPEHAIPAALRAGMTVPTVCDDCNEWAGKEIDKPFLQDDFILILRALHDVRDHRGGPNRQARVPNPLARGITDDGVRVVADHDWVPRVQHGAINYDSETGDYIVIAGDDAELDKLNQRLARRVAKDGKTATPGPRRSETVQPRVQGQLKVRPWIWRREIAKIALACSSVAYAEDWRTGDDALLLRAWMRDPKALPYDHCPFEQIENTPLDGIVPAPDHAMFFMRGSEQTILTIVLFGELVFKLPVDSTGRPAPDIAWYLDTTKPDAPGTTTRGQLLTRKLHDQS